MYQAAVPFPVKPDQEILRMLTPVVLIIFQSEPGNYFGYKLLVSEYDDILLQLVKSCVVDTGQEQTW